MAWNSLKLAYFLSILLSFFISNLPTSEADDPNFLLNLCTYNYPRQGKTSANSTFHTNCNTLFKSLSSKATVEKYYNTTIGSGSSDIVYGQFMCRDDISSQLCGQCIQDATQTLSSNCNLSTWGIAWYFECTVRYSNDSFFSNINVETTDLYTLYQSYATVSNNQERFMFLVTDRVNKTADNAAFLLDGGFATNETNVSENNQTIYSLAQCAKELSPKYCRKCLAAAIATLQDCCQGSEGALVMYPSCNIRYELYPFYDLNNVSRGGLPTTKYSSKPESNYLSHECSRYTSNEPGFEQNIKTLLSYLSSNATISANNGFFKTDINSSLFGLFMCRIDIPPHICGQCVANATNRIASYCSSTNEAIIWYNNCLLRFSAFSFFSKVSTSPMFKELNVTDASDVGSSFRFTRLSNELVKVVDEASGDDERYRMKSFVLNDNQTIYVLAQCTRDLAPNDCGACLSDIIGSGIPWSRLASVGGRVLCPSCTLRFELFKFYKDVIRVHAPTSLTLPPTTDKKRKDRSREIVLIVVPIVVLVILFFFCCYLLWKKLRRNHILKENFGHESTTVESLQFDLATIKAATNNFSHENKIGKGGCGEVYKGILPDGRHIDAKRLLRSYKQGVSEFKNEVLLIARLQHRNLVAFIGFCLEEEEKILIYEYVPNKSLDYFLFDSHSEKINWSQRYKIMEGTARGILYLHEHSRLKVIHRDLKPSNVLLDENINPKISDFDLARIIEIDQQEGTISKIVGTLGYMSPEYVMLGHFSEKSDVFSFGVMVLEIITGKKNITSHESRRIADGLLSSVWRQFKSQTPLSIVDPILKENCHDDGFEVIIRCIQIGLLCVQEDPDDRPTMMTIVSYFSTRSIELPFPREPAFFLRHNTDPEMVMQNYSSSSSINMMSSISNPITPR